MTPREFLTNWTVKYVKKNYSNLNITYDGAYGFDDNRWGDKHKVKLSKLVKDLKEDFGIVEWVLLEILWWDETITTKDTTKDTPFTIYNLDGTYIKTTPVDNPDILHYREWVWEYYTPPLVDTNNELFERLKGEMIKYCTNNPDVTLESLIQWHIKPIELRNKAYEEYNQRKADHHKH
jgi:hypothetical protein